MAAVAVAGGSGAVWQWRWPVAVEGSCALRPHHHQDTRAGGGAGVSYHSKRKGRTAERLKSKAKRRG